MKILWMSDSPTAPTGFGNVTHHVCAGLEDLGHQVSILGWQTQSVERWHNCTLYPFRFADGFTADAFDMGTLLEYLDRLRPDVFIIQTDLLRLTCTRYPILASFAQAAGIVWSLYYPISCDMGDGRLPSDWIDLLKTVELPIVMSRYGAEAGQANGVEAACIPLGVDTRVFHPPASREQAKRALGYDGQFVILSDARNQPRKLLPRALEIFRRFAEGKDDVLLHLHCDPDDPAAHTPEYCYDLCSAIAEFDLTSKVRITPGMSIAAGLELSDLVKLYQAADVHLLASWGEGFGLPTLQAAATGVVPLASDYTASRELTQGHGEAIRVHHFWADRYGLRHAFIDIDDAVSRLERLYRDRESLIAKAERARRFALGYDWDRIVREWHELLQRAVLPRARYPWLRRGKTEGKKEGALLAY